jgi:A nuclease family of the HNH/ENDO VII superfamily with conserved AHH
MRLAAQGEAGMEKARVLLMQAKGVPQGMVDEVMEVLSPSQEMVGVGRLSRQEMRGNTAGVTTEEAVQQAKARKPPKLFEEYANAGSVKPFIGTKVDPNNLPEGYLYGKIPVGKDAAGQEVFREVVYLPKSDRAKVPLIVENGKIRMGTPGEYRVVNDKVYPKNVETIPGQPGKILEGDSQVHHLFADNMLRSTPFGQRALKLSAFNPDDARNLIELANSTKNLEKAREAHPNVKSSDFVHNTQHPKFDGLMQEVVDKQITAVREAKGISGDNERFIPQMTKEEVQTVWNKSLARMRRGLMGDDTELYMEIEKRTRPGKSSLAQGENLDNFEVA